MEVCGQHQDPVDLPPGKEVSVSIGSVGPRAGLDAGGEVKCKGKGKVVPVLN
jgi:hypothetical protein